MPDPNPASTPPPPPAAMSPLAESRALLSAAVGERMLTPKAAREIARDVERAGVPAATRLVDAGLLTGIQADALMGLVYPGSVATGYTVEGLLGYGGIGVVYRAMQPGLRRSVALKTISKSRLREGGGNAAIARFEQEAQAIARLKHPGIVTAYDFGAGPDRLYLAMELVEGVDLDTLIKQRDRIDEPTAWRLIRQAAAALGHALQAGVIHRDIKPANLLLCDPPAGYPLPAGVPMLKVSDFGLARLSQPPASGEATRLTTEGATMGTPHYMAPEQIDNADVDHRADVYALGATAWHMIAGEPPLGGLSLMKVFAAKLAGAGADPDDLPPDVSPATRDLLVAMLRHAQDDRPGDYSELVHRIDGVLGEDAAAFSTAPIAAPPPVSKSVFSRGARAEPRTARWPRRRFVGVCVGAAAAGAAAIWWARRPRQPPEPRYELANGGSDARPLFDGQSAPYPEWIDADVNVPSTFAGRLRVSANTRREFTPRELSWLDGAEHFSLQLSVKFAEGAGEDDGLEVHLAPGGEGPAPVPGGVPVVRIGPRRVGAGMYDAAADAFQATCEPAPIAASPTADAPTFYIDRDERQWLVYQAPPGDAARRLRAWAPIVGGPPTKFRFRPMGEAAGYAGELWLNKLRPR